MKKVVIKKAPADTVESIVIFAGSLDKNAVIVNKLPDYDLVLIQGKDILATYPGKCRFKVSPKAFPSIKFDKKAKKYLEMYIILSKKNHSAYYFSAIGKAPKVVDDLKPKNITEDVKIIQKEKFWKDNTYSLCAIFKTERVDYATLISNFSDSLKNIRITPASDIVILNNVNIKALLELDVNDVMRDDVPFIYGLDDVTPALNIEQILDLKEKSRERVIAKLIEAKIEETMRSAGIYGKASVIGVKDNILLYI